MIFIWQKKCQHDYSGNEPTIIPSEKYQVPHYFFKKKISFFLTNKELLDFFLGKGNAFFNRSIIELIVVAPKKK